MGYMKHLTVVVTHWDSKNVQKAHDKAIEILSSHNETIPFPSDFSRLVSDIVDGVTNGYASFFIAPDGSKEGWSTSDKCEKAINEFLDWLRAPNCPIYCNYVMVRFGGDDDHENIERSTWMDGPSEDALISSTNTK